MRIYILLFTAVAGPVLTLAAEDKIPDPVQYNYAAQIAALQDGSREPGGTSGSKSVDSTAVPKAFRLRTDVPLTAVAMEAVRVSERLRGEGPDSRCRLRWSRSVQLWHRLAHGRLRTAPGMHPRIAGRRAH